MTHEERARLMFDEIYGSGVRIEDLEQYMFRHLAEASNAELYRRRAVEVARDQLGRLVEACSRGEGEGGLAAFLERKSKWSERTFGPGQRTGGIIAHIQKELAEIQQDPLDLMEWVDVANLAMDGFWRAFFVKYQPDETHHDPHGNMHWRAAAEFVWMIQRKAEINEARRWPAPVSDDLPVEHVREASCDR